jgi:hypothetical protein
MPSTPADLVERGHLAAQVAAQQAADALGDARLVAVLHEQVRRGLLQEFAQALRVLHHRQLQPARVERQAEMRLPVAHPGLEDTRRFRHVRGTGPR